MKKKQLTLAQRFARVHAMFREVADAIAEDGYPMPGPDCWLNKSFFARGGDWFSPEVWLSMGLAGDGEVQVRVNWSAIGAQSPAAAVVAARQWRPLPTPNGREHATNREVVVFGGPGAHPETAPWCDWYVERWPHLTHWLPLPPPPKGEPQR